MEFWNESSNTTKAGIVGAGVIIVCAVIAIIALLFSGLLDGGGAEPAPPVAVVTATALPTEQPTVPTAAPQAPNVTANVNVNVRTGPGIVYQIAGQMLQGQSAEALGVSPDRAWWVINFPAAPGGQGWVAAGFVRAENAENLLIVQPPPPPQPTATPTTPVVITEWRGDYYANRDLREAPVLVRNDPNINFNWGTGSPGQNVPANNFSVRWTRRLDFEGGTHTFFINLEGGARLWVDGLLLIDSWGDQGPRELAADSPGLNPGGHDIRVEYFKAQGNGRINLRWERRRPDDGPPRAVINGPARAEVGQPVNFNARNSGVAPGSHIVSFDWDFGDGTTGRGVDVSHTYQTANIYNVALTVRDDKGRANTAFHRIEIVGQPDQPPQPVINAPSQAEVGEAILFDARQSISANPIVSYAWNFGDGTSADAIQVNKTYGAAGIYNITLALTDNQGLRGSTQKQIEIVEGDAPGPTVEPGGGLEDFAWALVDDPSVTLTFSGSSFAGFAGCNNISGQYIADGDNISLSILTQTEQACDPAVTERQTQYLAALQAANQFQVSGRQLTLSGGGTLVYNGWPKGVGIGELGVGSRE